MSQKIPIYIPIYINNAEYSPARVLPRLLFYNGQLECATWWISDKNDAGSSQNTFPYFDNYNVVSGSFPTVNSKSLLFNNEAAAYGEIPTQNLYTEYWEKYISLLYNPKTRLINASAIIPLADYFDMELNDVVQFRGNYYHLRAINEYSLQTGECNIQLLGPIIGDTLSENALPCKFDFSVSETVWTVNKCDNSEEFLGVTFNTTSSLSNGQVITWGTPGIFEGCFKITASMDTPDLTGSIVYSVFDSCEACTPTTTTTSTTTTLAPTTTTTTFTTDPCNCVEVNITSAGGEVATFNCYGVNENYVYMSAGTYYLCAAVVGGLLQAEIVSGTGTLSPIGNCKTGTCPPTTTTTTSTTTTIGVCNSYRIENNTETSVSISYYNCNGVLVSDNLGSGQQITFCANTGYGPIETGGATLFNLGACTTTTTTTPPTTTTTTTTIAYDFYLADEYSCDPCTFQQSNVLVAFPAGTSIVVLNRYYKPAFITGFVYKNFTPTTAGAALIMTVTGNSINCGTACGTTTTTTLGPVEYQIDNGASGTSGDACSSATTTSIVYAAGGNNTPMVGLILYTNISLTTPFVGSTGWRKLTGPVGTYAVEINTSGEITNYVTC